MDAVVLQEVWPYLIFKRFEFTLIPLPLKSLSIMGKKYLVLVSMVSNHHLQFMVCVVELLLSINYNHLLSKITPVSNTALSVQKHLFKKYLEKEGFLIISKAFFFSLSPS